MLIEEKRKFLYSYSLSLINRPPTHRYIDFDLSHLINPTT